MKCPGRKWDLIRQIRVAENVLQIPKLGPLHRHTVEELSEIWKRYFAALKERGLVNDVLVADRAKRRAETRRAMDQAAKDLGLVKVRGAVSGRIYYE